MRSKTAKIVSVGLGNDFAAIDEFAACHIKASNSTEAVRLLRTLGPDLVLLKWRLTDMPGEMLLKRVMAAKPTVATIVMVEPGSIDQEIDARSAGATAVVDETIDEKLLCEMTIQLCQCSTAVTG